jgi:hypothetical protein
VPPTASPHTRVRITRFARAPLGYRRRFALTPAFDMHTSPSLMWLGARVVTGEQMRASIAARPAAVDPRPHGQALFP